MEYYLIRKLGHVTVYFILTLLILRALHKKQLHKNYKMIVVAFIISIIYAISDEYHQSLTGFRDGRIKDVAIDSIGILLAILSYMLLIPKSFIKQKSQNT